MERYCQKVKRLARNMKSPGISVTNALNLETRLAVCLHRYPQFRKLIEPGSRSFDTLLTFEYTPGILLKPPRSIFKLNQYNERLIIEYCRDRFLDNQGRKQSKQTISRKLNLGSDKALDAFGQVVFDQGRDRIDCRQRENPVDLSNGRRDASYICVSPSDNPHINLSLMCDSTTNLSTRIKATRTWMCTSRESPSMGNYNRFLKCCTMPR